MLHIKTFYIQCKSILYISSLSICCSLFCSGNGYVRSEAVVGIFLQKHKDSKRVYAQLVHSKTNSDGAKEDGKSRQLASTMISDFVPRHFVDLNVLLSSLHPV